MLIIELPNSNSVAGTKRFITTNVQNQNNIPPAPTVEAAGDFDICAFECGYKEYAFASTTSDDFWKNDQSSFLQSKSIDTDTIAYELYRNGSKVADLNDDTYGTFYANFTERPLYVGFVLNWQDVLTAFGTGRYQVKSQNTILGVSSEFESRVFQLYPYSDELADNTVRVEFYQNGNILSNPLNYQNLVNGGWYQSYRVPGFFGRKTPTLEVDEYLNQNYQSRQIQDKIITEYSYISNLLPSDIFNVLVNDLMLADIIEVTDYNLFNTETFRRVGVKASSFDDVSYFDGSRDAKLTLKFTEATQDRIKRTF